MWLTSFADAPVDDQMEFLPAQGNREKYCVENTENEDLDLLPYWINEVHRDKTWMLFCPLFLGCKSSRTIITTSVFRAAIMLNILLLLRRPS